MRIDWTDEGTAHLRNGDESSEVVGVLMFLDQSAQWLVVPSLPSKAEGTNLHIDDDRSDALRSEREELALMMDGPTRDALIAEWRGRAHLFRDETRDLAEMGARVYARRWR